MDTVDKSLKEVKWCDHLKVACNYIKLDTPVVLITSPVTYLIVEEGKIKLLCGHCLRSALSHGINDRDANRILRESGWH